MKYLKETIPYGVALKYFRNYPESNKSFLLESVDVSPIYGRISLFCPDPPLEIVGKDNNFRITSLNAQGELILKKFKKSDFKYADKLEITKQEIKGQVKRVNQKLSEAERLKQPNISFVIRTILKKFKNKYALSGLYGAFSYDFVRLFEDLPDKHDHGTTPDFHLFLPDLIYYFDNIKEKAYLHYFNFTNQSLDQRLENIETGRYPKKKFSVAKLKSNFSEKKFISGVKKAKQYMKIGDIFEMVLSQNFSAQFSGSPLSLYEKYREVNPSPYMFYFNFGDNQLLGASPEMFLRVDKGIVSTRPISGTARRSLDPILDYENMMELFNSVKEKSELDMLIDLGRNDISRVCLPGVKVSDYRFLEKYSRVMHTVAHVTGRLDAKNYSALDAFIACLNAGTLTGAPKIRAMELIEEMEPERRGYYGGNIGYLTFDNQLNTGIIIRSAVIKDKKINVQAGATLLYDSEPESEHQETIAKAEALIKLLKQ